MSIHARYTSVHTMARKDRPVIYPRPRHGTRTARVWEIADEITRETGRRASRRDVVERIVTESGNRGTANTQYQHWKTSYDSTHTPVAPDEDLRNVESQSLSVAPDGRLVIPQEMREAMLLDEGSAGDCQGGSGRTPGDLASRRNPTDAKEVASPQATGNRRG